MCQAVAFGATNLTPPLHPCLTLHVRDGGADRIEVYLMGRGEGNDMTRMLLGAALIAASCGLLIAEARAEPFPEFSPEKLCALTWAEPKPTDTMGGMRKICTDQERVYAERLRKVWGKIPADIQKQCMEGLKAQKEGSYVAVGGCTMSFYVMRWFEQGGEVKP